LFEMGELYYRGEAGGKRISKQALAGLGTASCRATPAPQYQLALMHYQGK